MITNRYDKEVLAYVVDAKTNEVICELTSGSRIFPVNKPMKTIRPKWFEEVTPKGTRSVLAEVVDYETGQIIDELYRGDKILHYDGDERDITSFVCKQRAGFYKRHPNYND